MIEGFIKNFVDFINFLSPRRISRIKKVLDNKSDFVALVLDDINQPHNASAVLRSFEAFGFINVYVVEKKAKFMPVKGISNSAEKWLIIKKFKDYEECYNKLKKEGYRICVTVPYEKEKNIVTPQSISLDKKIAIVIGNEMDGVGDFFKGKADLFMSIKTVGFVESLNLSVACGIIMYELRKKLEEGNVNFYLSPFKKTEIFSKWLYKSIPFISRIKGGS